MALCDNIRIRQQGDLDGLCGVYSIVHFVLRYKCTDSGLVASRVFNLTLEGLANANALLPQKIRGGIGQGKLRQAFDYMAEHERLPVRAHTLSSYSRRFDASNVFEVLRELKSNEGVMALIPAPQHWVLAHSPKAKTFLIDDSAEGRVRQVTGNTIAHRQFSSTKGLVFANA